MSDSPEQREVTFEQALDALERLGFLHPIPAGQGKSFYQWGVDVQNGGDQEVRVAVFKGG